MCFSDTRRRPLLLSEKHIGPSSCSRKAHRAPFQCRKSTQGPLLVSAPGTPQQCQCIFRQCWAIFVENMQEIYFLIGGGIILLLGAPFKSKFDGLKSRKHRFAWFLAFWDPWEPLFVVLNIPIYFKNSKKRSNSFWEIRFIEIHVGHFKSKF